MTVLLISKRRCAITYVGATAKENAAPASPDDSKGNVRASKHPLSKPKTLADLIGKAMTPLCRKRGFASVDIVAAWPEIVGPRYGERVQPDRLSWPRRKNAEGEDIAEPATLVVHTDGPTALMLSHESPQIIERINTFFGWAAVNRIKINQKPVMQRVRTQPVSSRPLSTDEKSRVDRQVQGVENDRLREALRKLGEQVIAHDKTGAG